MKGTNTKPSQCDRIVRHLKDYGSISSAEAMSEYGIYRLASRISELKKRGESIKAELVKVKTVTVNRHIMQFIALRRRNEQY